VKQSFGEFLLDALFPVFAVLGVAVFAIATALHSTHVSDFAQDYLAAYALRHGVPIYGPALEQLSQPVMGFHQYNVHPPTNAVLFIPFSYLSYRAAFIAWNVLGLVAFAVLLKAIVEEADLPRPLARTCAAAAVLWHPFLADVYIGQVSIYTALGLVVSWRCLRRGRDLRAGAVLGAVSLVKLFPLLFVVFLLALRRWRAALALATTAAAGIAAVALITGIQPFVEYVRSVASDDVQVWAAYPINYSITGLAAVLSNLGPHRWDMPVVLDVSWRTASLVASLVGAALVGTTALLAARAWRSVRGAEQCYAAGATAMLLASPFVWSHMFLVLLWPGATLLRDRGLLGPTVRWIVAGAYLLLSLPDVNLAHAIVDRYAPRPVPVVAVLFLKLPTIGLLTLWAVFCSRARSCTVAQPNST